MDTTTSFTPSVAAPPRQPDLPPSTGTKKRGPQRKWSLAALCALVTLLGALAGAVMLNRAGDRIEVLAVARDVPLGQTITAQDVKTVSFAEDPGLSPIKADERSSVVGKRAAVELRSGSLFTRSQLVTGAGLGDDEQVVGIEVKRGYAPRNELRPGDKVSAVVLPAQGEQPTASGKAGQEQAEPEAIAATVTSVSRPDASGAQVVNVAVPAADGPRLAMRAAAKQIALVREPRGTE
ncbi:SAF domain-containing protein [Streptomyces sp. LHD-70]|uniref:SAF domain-containing protein n=1 Tax=Streptomyces sp. LHD-70 TaxID=3072140 RepID=UPI00280F7A7A|nr:SAF domain-containing protein [Streptomyces sp. LHD-70]MDQ8707514.1 SAF domain-containing protein [Streptomyces sp. LHD-70]